MAPLPRPTAHVLWEFSKCQIKLRLGQSSLERLCRITVLRVMLHF